MDTPVKSQPAGHVLLPAVTIGALSMLLVVGLHVLGLLARGNDAVSRSMTLAMNGTFPKSLSLVVVGLAALVLAFGLSFVILAVPTTWRRIVLWVTTLVLVGAWAPVLSLAAYAPDIAAPWIASAWSGVCALVYAANHSMACDVTRAPLETTPQEDIS
jgi:hypothetical protein